MKEQLATRIEHDRALPVGVARFQSIDANGRPTPVITVKADLPTCALGALSEAERCQFEPAPAASPQAAPGGIAKPLGSDLPAGLEIAFLGLCAAFLPGCLAFVAWAIQSGHIGVCVAFLIGGWFALRGRIGAALR